MTDRAEVDWNVYRVHAAQETTGPGAPVRLEIGPNMLRDDDPLPRSERFEEEAQKVVDALYAGLPGGTVDYVTAELLRRQARRVVRHPHV